MRKILFLLGVMFVVGITTGIICSPTSGAQEALKMGTILGRTDLVDAKGMEAILVLREIPPSGESGKHTQNSNELVYISEGSVIVEIEGKPPLTLKAGETFSTSKGQVHNVKNASKTEPAKALAFYIAKKGSKLEDLSVPVKP